MKRILMTASLIAAAAGGAQAGGIDRSGISYGVLFEDGNYAELSFSSVNPEVSGTYPAALGGGSTGNMAGGYTTVGLAYKHQFTDKFAVAVFINQPYGADANYTMGAYTGLSAQWKSTQVAAIAKYQATDNVSVYGGLRYVQSEAEIAIPALLSTAGASTSPAFNYTASGAKDGQVAWLAGVAYERPDIAMRISLTYESGYTHKFDTIENAAGFGLTDFATVTEIEMPQAVTLAAQSGIAQDTLLFGSIRWSEWSVWEVRTAGFLGATGQRVTGLDNDVTTYQLGVGRRFSDQFSAFVRLGYEKANGGVASRLTPTDGQRSIGIGGTYTMDNVKITGGIEYLKIGDAVDGSTTTFADNSALGVGVRVGVSF